MAKVNPCNKCGGIDIDLFDCGYSSFNVGGGKCRKCGRSVTENCLDCLPAKKQLAEIWNDGNPPQTPCANCSEPIVKVDGSWWHTDKDGEISHTVCRVPGAVDYLVAMPDKPKELKHRIVVCAAVVRNDKMVMQLRAPHKAYGANTWFLPGGKVEWQEGIEKATVRELKEELGITVSLKNVHIITMKEVIREGAHDIMVFVHVDKFRGTPKNLDTKNTTRIAWLDVYQQYPKLFEGFPLHETKETLYQITNYCNYREYEGREYECHQNK